VAIDFPVDETTAVPPGAKREPNHPLSVTLRSQFGRDSAIFEWRAVNEDLPLTRGVVHFGFRVAMLRNSGHLD
jgi:methionine-rich copper-binding protein CopC